MAALWYADPSHAMMAQDALLGWEVHQYEVVNGVDRNWSKWTRPNGRLRGLVMWFVNHILGGTAGLANSFWGGFGSDLENSDLGGLWHHINCHGKGCWRPGHMVNGTRVCHIHREQLLAEAAVHTAGINVGSVIAIVASTVVVLSAVIGLFANSF